MFIVERESSTALLKLSHQGLRGDGKLKYLTSTSLSNDFLFLPEEMKTIASSFNIEEKMGDVQYPPTTGTNIEQVWSPYDDKLHCESTKEPFIMYDGSTLTGSMDLNPEELTGAGLFAFDKAELESKLFHFEFSGFNSDTADFRLKSESIPLMRVLILRRIMSRLKLTLSSVRVNSFPMVEHR